MTRSSWTTTATIGQWGSAKTDQHVSDCMKNHHQMPSESKEENRKDQKDKKDNKLDGNMKKEEKDHQIKEEKDHTPLINLQNHH